MAVFVRRGVLVGTRLDRREFLFVKAMVALPARHPSTFSTMHNMEPSLI